MATHHRIIVRHMHDGIFRAGCMTSDIGDVSANKAEDCERRAIETMIGYGDFDLGEDTYEIEFVDSAGNSSVHQRASLIPPQEPDTVRTLVFVNGSTDDVDTPFKGRAGLTEATALALSIKRDDSSATVDVRIVAA